MLRCVHVEHATEGCLLEWSHINNLGTESRGESLLVLADLSHLGVTNH